jgi:aryl-alcohol dehydrogenase-like predicted oxidoreductase
VPSSCGWSSGVARSTPIADASNGGAARYGVSVPQLSIRYVVQLGLVALPKTANPEHMRSNAEVDFVISDEDMDTVWGSVLYGLGG